MYLNLTFIPAPTAPNVLEVTSTVSTLQSITKSANNAIFVPGLYRFSFDARVWIRFSEDGTTVPDIVISDETGDGGECWSYAPGEYLISITDNNLKFKVIAEDTTYMRYFFERSL